MKRTSTYLLILTLGLAFTGCINDDGTISTEDTIAALTTMIDTDEAFSIDELDDGGLQEEDYVIGEGDLLTKVLADTLWPDNYDGIRWGRRITGRSRDIVFEGLETDTAYATIYRTISGVFMAAGWIYDTTTGSIIVVDTLFKDYEMGTERRVRFIRVSDDGDAEDRWRLDGMTAILGTAGSRVSLENLDISLSTDTMSTYFSISRDEVLNRFFNRRDLPHFRPRTPVRVYATVANVGPEFPLGSGERVVLRHGRRGDHQFTRFRLNDLGLGPDEVALDNIFSGRWIPHRRPASPRINRIFLEVIDYTTLFVEDEYHVEFLGLPYLINDDHQSPPFHP